MPRLGLATIDISTLGGSGGAVTGIDDFFFESFSAGQMHPILTTSRTNLLIYSQDFDNAAWSHNADITVTNSSELAPNGNLEANLIEFDGSGYSFIRRVISATSTAATLSVFAKKGNWRYLGLRNFQTQGEDHTVFDFDTETFSNTASGQTASFEILSNGWYRIIVTQPSPDAAAFVGFAISNASGSELNTTGGQVANVHLFGAQLEQDGFVSNYIPTSGSTVTVSTTLNDTSNVWDFDGTDIMIAEDPEDEGFWEESYPDGATLPELVLNGDYEELGSELVTNGDFSSDTWWQKSGANVNISNGKGNFTAGTTEYFYKTNTLTIGKTYKLVFEITDYTTGYISLFGGSFGAPALSAGTYERYFTCADTTFGLVGNSFVGSIDNVSVKQVDPNDRWTLGTGWTISDGKANFGGSGSATTALTQNISLTNGNTYNIRFTVSNATGNAKIWIGNGPGSINYFGVSYVNRANGTYDLNFTMTSTQSTLAFFANQSGSNFSLDNVSVTEYAIQPKDI